jgi:hypothetical protein
MPPAVDPSIGRAEVLFGGSLALLSAAGLWTAWTLGGIPVGAFVAGLEGHGPDPLAWPRLLVWVPIAQALFLAAHAWLARASHPIALRRWFVADQVVTMGLLLALAALLLALREPPTWRAGVGAWYVLFVAAKTAFFLRALWGWLAEGEPDAGRATRAVFLGAVLPYLALGAHLTTAISATGDEPYYLLVTHSLLEDGDVDLADDFAQRSYAPFYWDTLNPRTSGVRRTADGRIQARSFQGLQPVLLLPGYWAAGRAGAVATVNLIAALALALAFRLALVFGASRRGAFLAWLGVAFSVPVLSFAASPWPEMTGALCLTGAVLLLCREPRTPAAALAAALCLAVAVAVKPRLLLLAVPVLLGFPHRMSRRAVPVLAGIAVAAFALVAVYDAAVFDATVRRRAGPGGALGALSWLVRWTVQAPAQYRGHLGLLLDQEFGLLASAPVFALALAGAAVVVRERRWRVALLTAGPFALAWYYLGAFVTSRGPHWYGGFSPPGRFVAASLPLLAVCLALALDRLRGRLVWSVVAGLYAATLGYALVIQLWPGWRFQHAIGRATALVELFRLSGIDAGRLLPSYIAPGDGWVAPGVALLLATLGAGWLAACGDGTPSPRGTWLTGVGGLGLVLAVAPVGLALHSGGSYPALLGRGRGGMPFRAALTIDSGERLSREERLVWAAQRAAALDLRPRLRAGRYRIAVRAGSQGRPDGPLLRIRLGELEGLPHPMSGASPPAWREQEHVLETTWPGGRLPIRVDLTEVSVDPPSRLAYLDAIEIRRLATP